MRSYQSGVAKTDTTSLYVLLETDVYIQYFSLNYRQGKV